MRILLSALVLVTISALAAVAAFLWGAKSTNDAYWDGETQ